jgi:hypothetical protein
MKSRRLRWEEHVVRMEERVGAYRTSVGKPERRKRLEDRDLDGIVIILKLIVGKWDGGAWTGLIWFRIGTDVALL